MSQNDEDVTIRGDGMDAGPNIASDPAITLAWSRELKKRNEVRLTPVRLGLPSGKAIMVLRLPLRYLIQYNLIPDPITAIVKQHIEEIEGPKAAGAVDRFMEDWEANPEATFGRWLRLLRGIFMACAVQPTFTDDVAQVNLDAGPFDIGDVDYYDLLYVYQWAQGVDESVADFLHKQSEAMARLEDGASLRSAAEPVVRLERRGGSVVSIHRGPGDLDVGQSGRDVDEGDGPETRHEDQEASDGQRAEAQPGVDQPGDLRTAPKRAKGSPRPPRSRRDRSASRSQATGSP